MNWILTATPCSFSAGDAATGLKRCISKNYPQTFVIRTFYLLMIPDAGFLEKMCG